MMSISARILLLRLTTLQSQRKLTSFFARDLLLSIVIVICVCAVCFFSIAASSARAWTACVRLFFPIWFL